MSNYNDETANENMIYCDCCQYLKEPTELIEIGSKLVCKECEPLETLLSKIKTFGYDSFICTLSYNKGIYKLPLDLNSIESIPANKFGVSFDEFVSLLWEYESTSKNRNEISEIFEEETKIFKL